MRKAYSISSNRPGLTLVEVITSVVLLSTLLVGMLTAYSRHVRQIQRASELDTACRLADELLGSWFRNAEPLSVHKSGIFESNSEYGWKLTTKSFGAENQVGAQILLLQILKFGESSPQSVLDLELLDEIPAAFREAR